MISALLTVGYFIVLIVTARIVYNNALKKDIENLIREWKETEVKSPNTHVGLSGLTDDELFLKAYKDLSGSSELVLYSITLGAIWPAIVGGLLIFKLFRATFRGFTAILPENETAKKFKQIEETRKLKEENTRLLKLAKDAGLSAEYLRNENYIQ